MTFKRLSSIITHVAEQKTKANMRITGFLRIPQDAQIAQLVEQRTENPRVTGSIPVLGIWGISSVGRALDF